MPVEKKTTDPLEELRAQLKEFKAELDELRREVHALKVHVYRDDPDPTPFVWASESRHERLVVDGDAVTVRPEEKK